MLTYFTAVVITIILSSSALVILLKRNNMLNGIVVAGITLSSAVVSILFPFIFNYILDSYLFANLSAGTVVAFLLSLVIYVFLALLFSLAISIGAGNKKVKGAFNYVINIIKKFRLSAEKIKKDPLTVEPYLDKILQEKLDNEKFVDTTENTDKMGLEVLAEVQAAEPYQDAGCTTINDFVDRAFRLKLEGNFEGAIQQYMNVLEKKPEKDLVFWIILDICVLYKSLGQAELAISILESYVDIYGDIMESSVRFEIERNLMVA